MYISLQTFEYRDVALLLGGILSLNILGALVYKTKPSSINNVDKKDETASIEDDNCHSLKQSIKKVANPVLITYFLNTLLWNGGYVLMRVYLHSYITATYSSKLWAGTALTLLGVGQLVFSIVMSLINAKFNTNKYLIHIIGVSFMGCSVCAMGLVDNIYIIVGLICLYGGMFGVLLSNIPSFVKHLNGTRSHNLVYALSQTCGGLGALMAPPILPVIQQTLPDNSLFFFSAGFCALSFLLMVGLLMIKSDLWSPFYETKDKNDDVKDDEKGVDSEHQSDDGLEKY